MALDSKKIDVTVEVGERRLARLSLPASTDAALQLQLLESFTKQIIALVRHEMEKAP